MIMRVLFILCLVSCWRNAISFAPSTSRRTFRRLRQPTTATTTTSIVPKVGASEQMRTRPCSGRRPDSSARHVSLDEQPDVSRDIDRSTHRPSDNGRSDQLSHSSNNRGRRGDDDMTQVDDEGWVDASKHVELVGLLVWMASISGFILVNNFVGPWPAFMDDVPERVWFLGHMLGGMLFGGGVLLTTCIEWLVTQNKNPAVLQFWFDKVPLLDMALVLPGLTLSMVSGTGLTIERYGGLAIAPAHIRYAFWALVAFAAWWGMTDLTTQGSALNAVLEVSQATEPGDDVDRVPREVTGRWVSNAVSCLLVLVMYGIMVLKPGTLHY